MDLCSSKVTMPRKAADDSIFRATICCIKGSNFSTVILLRMLQEERVRSRRLGISDEMGRADKASHQQGLPADGAKLLFFRVEAFALSELPRRPICR